MAIKLAEKLDGKVLEVQVTGRLVHEDYTRFVPEFERLVKQHGKINVLFEMVERASQFLAGSCKLGA